MMMMMRTTTTMPSTPAIAPMIIGRGMLIGDLLLEEEGLGLAELLVLMVGCTVEGLGWPGEGLMRESDS